MKKINFFNPYILIIALLLLITSCKKTDQETLPVNTASGVSADAASSVKSSGIINTTSSSTTIQNKSVIIPPVTVPAPFGGPPSITNASVVNGNIVTTPSVTNLLITATLQGTINANYLPTTVTFEYGRVLVIGVISSGSFNISQAAIPTLPITGNLNTNVYTIVQPLLLNTTYQFRIKAVNKLGTVYSNPVLFTTVGHRIGESFAGGVIFYIDNSGQHGFIASTVDQGSYTFNGSTLIKTSTGTEIGSGPINTKNIVSAQGVGNYAASICDKLVLNGYNDWFLPSQAELYLMYSNLKVTGIENFSTGYYWSSTEYGNGMALAQTFSNGLQVISNNNLSYRVRAVRAF